MAEKKRTLKNDITVLVGISVSVLLFIIIFFEPSGSFNKFLTRCFKGIFGYVTYLIPFIVFLRALKILFSKNQHINFIYKFWCLESALLFINLIAHIIFYKGHLTIPEWYMSGVGLKSGGLFSGLVTFPFIYFFGPVITIIIFCTFLAIILMMVTKFSLLEFISKIFSREKKNVIKQTEKSIINKKIQYVEDTIISEEDDIEEDTKEYSEDDYSYPNTEILDKNTVKPKTTDDYLKTKADKLISTLKSFGVEAVILKINKGPTVTRYEVQPSIGVKVSKIVNLSDDIALNLAAMGVRIEAPVPGKSVIGIEIPNEETTPVLIGEIIESNEFKKSPSKVSIALGKDITGKNVIADISKMPHLLIAGSTGSGKSVCINSIIVSILYKASPEDVRLILIDPKVVELGIYNGIPHLMIPVVTNPKKASNALNWAVREMGLRYTLFAENNVRDLSGYNEMLMLEGQPKLPQIVIIIDELSDLMMTAPGEVEESICRLAQMARAAGMYLVIATQRPSVDVVTGLIKANIPSRIAFAVSSQIDSKIILDLSGAEKLIGRGDMLFNPIGISKPVRVQGAYITDKEVENIVSLLRETEEVDYIDEIIQETEKKSIGEVEQDLDSMFWEAVEVIIQTGQASVSNIQRKLKVGYARAGRIMDQIQNMNLVSPPDGSKPREILISKAEFQEMYSNRR